MLTKDQEARKLAALHYEIEPDMMQIFRLSAGAEAEAKPEEPIKLLEVNQGTVATGIMPLKFDPLPSRDIHYATVIVEITPEEFAKLQARELTLPHGWVVGDLLPRPAVKLDEHAARVDPGLRTPGPG